MVGEVERRSGYLRTGVLHGALHAGQPAPLAPLIQLHRMAEVYQLQTQVAVQVGEEEVVGHQVEVNDVLVVDEGEGLQHLHHGAVVGGKKNLQDYLLYKDSALLLRQLVVRQ